MRSASLVFSVVLVSCMPSDSVPLADFQRKSQEVDSLRAVIDELQNGPARLLARAQTALDQGNYALAKNVAQQLVTRFPERSEAGHAHKLVTGAEAGIAAEAARRQREQERAMAGMVKDRDDMRGLTVWRDRATPRTVNSRSWVGAYIVERDGQAPYLRMVIYYKASDWLFIERYMVKVDENNHRFLPDDYGADAVERDNGYGGIWEWWDVSAEGARLAFLRKLANASTATVRYDGRQYYHDREISSAERAALKRTLIAFDALVRGKG